MHVAESNVEIRFSTGFDMSSNTALELQFWAPSSTAPTDAVDLTKTDPDVTLGTTTVTETVDGVAVTFTANEWVKYFTIVTDFTTAGTWSARVKYTDTVTTPDTILYSDVTTFVVES